MMLRKYFLLFCLVSLIGSVHLNAQVILNAYANVTNISGTTFTVNNVNEVNHTFAAGQLVIIMQMQDDVIGTNTTNVIGFGDLGSIKSAGLWEVMEVLSVTRTSGTLQTVTFVSPLANTYTVGTNASLQIITFRSLSSTSFVSTANITGLAWNGFVGGVIALRVGTVFTLAHTISANGIGFRGGSKNVPNFASTSCETAFINAIGNKWAGKGEGIYKNTNTNWDGARAKILTGGGGGTDENSGGGGGGHFTIGGTGGPGYTGNATGCNPSMGALGGITLSTSISGSRIFMGGGGGAGHENNSVGTAGGNGGGIILIKTGTLTTTGTCGGVAITANGLTPANAGNDGSGGGGAGGSIVLNVNTFSIAATCPLLISSNAGNGGTANTPQTHSGGGGGAQGVVLYSTAQPTTNMTTTTNNGIGGCNESACATSALPASGSSNSGIFALTTSPLPIELKKFTASKNGSQTQLKWTTATEKNFSHFEVQRTLDGINYLSLGTVKSLSENGNSSLDLDYKFTDNNPEQGTNYYRLKLVDLDKSFKFSFTTEVDYGKILKLSDLNIFPNPSNGQFFLQLKNGPAEDQVLEFFLSDLSGRTIEHKTLFLNSSDPIELFNSIPSGYYILKVKTGSQELFLKLVVN